ncbi:PLP-dependent aminotransferase family protein [Paenibacillus sp. sptzw28]|uniref:aminotransferase-like domain-containing protein n=1 Tax=Paenibacillus sp. sptzw28 TaxID=715179 RepID=UPI001C6DE61F|nr:PLP-dependent aminotransferase family protein [Paenibacillus sp. sptzw28]QYR23351.1 PLP-dependent aminotransferase family protein [Paenibacillus sp. sptzw28]
MWKPEPSGERPVFAQIAGYFEKQILKGDLPPGAKLPTERELALQLCVNRSTISAAYEELRASGLVTSVQGSGTRVSDSLWEAAEVRTPNWQRYTAVRQLFDPTAALQSQVYGSFGKPNIINFVKGELSPDLMPLELLEQRLPELNLSEPFSYYCSFKGDAGLRRTISQRLQAEAGILTDPEHLLISAGVKHSLHLICHTLLQPGDAIAVEGPSYLYSMNVLSSAGLRLVKLPIDSQGLNPEQLPELARKHRVKMVLTNPTYQNPTGTTLSLARRITLLDICAQLRIPIIEDDPYSLLFLDEAGRSLPPLRALPGGDRTVIYLGTMSKIATPGMRIGWIIAPLTVTAKLAEAKSRMGYSTSHIGERLADRFLNTGGYEAHLSYIRGRLRTRRDCMLGAIREHIEPLAVPVLSNSRPGGYYVWLKLKKNILDRDMLEAAISEGVLCLPGRVFGADDGFLRLSFAAIGEEQIQEGVRRLGRALLGIT